jgi:hypothetical protein
MQARSPGYRSLHEAVRVLFSIWATLAWTSPQPPKPKDESLSIIYNRTRLRCRRVLEHLFRVQSGEVFESIVDCWNRDIPFPVRRTYSSFIVEADRIQDSKVPTDAAFELVDVLIANAQSVVHMICESISCRVSGISERTKKQAINPNLLVLEDDCHQCADFLSFFPGPMWYCSDFLSNICNDLRDLWHFKYGPAFCNW